MKTSLIAFVLGGLLTSFSPALPGVILLAGACALIGVSIFLFPTLWTSRFAFLMSVVTGCGLALVIAAGHGASFEQRQLDVTCVNQLLMVEGRIASLPVRSPSRFGGWRTRFEFVPLEPSPALPDSQWLTPPCAGPERLLLSYYGDTVLAYGQAWRFVVKLKQPRGLSNPGLFDLRIAHAQNAIDAVGSVKGEGERVHGPIVRRGSSALYDQLQLVRQKLRRRIAVLPYPVDVRGALAALVVADKSGIDDAFWQRISALGINHLFVISGLHVGFVAGLGYLVGKVLAAGLALVWQRAHYLSAAVSLLFAALYVGLAGVTLPTQRAFIMLFVFLVGAQLGRPQPGAVRLLVAAAVVLAGSPLAGLGAGFWLSFGAVAALLWLSRWQSQSPRWAQFLSTHAYMMVVMLPLGGYFFGGASVLAALANAVMVPLVGLVIVPLALLAAAAHVFGSWVEWPLWLAAGASLETALELVEQAVVAGGSSLFRHSSSSVWALLLALVGCVSIAMPLRRRLRLLLLSLFLPLLLVPVNTVGAGEPVAASTIVTVLDVGQGTAVVLQRGQRALLFDTGGGTPGGYTMAGAVILPFLRRADVAMLDSFIISHGDADHSAGWRDVLTALPAHRVRYGPDQRLPRGRACRAGESWRWPGGAVFRFLSPAQGGDLSSNDGSCVLQVTAGRHTLLLTGDIGGNQERDLASYWRGALASDWLLVAHHGSKTSSFWSFLKRVDPADAVITAGYANRFGHPHPGVVARLLEQGAQLYNTAESGAVTFVFHDSGEIEVTENRVLNERHWM